MRSGRSRQLLGIAICFLLASLSFVGSTFFADRRLGHIDELAHSVSENAMPSLVQLGAMRYDLAAVGALVDHAVASGEVDGAAIIAIEERLRSLERARRAYDSLPQFPGEPEVTARATPLLDIVADSATRIVADVDAGAISRAEEQLRRYRSAADAAEVALRELHQINLDQGTAHARMADHALQRTRIVSVVLDSLCALLTGALAYMALRFSRRAISAETGRADELDAFAARVAHDLRGPLSAPLMALHVLGRQFPPDSGQKAMVDRGTRSLQRADVLIRDLLLFARSAARAEPGARASLPEVVAGVVQDLEPEAEAARVQIEVESLPAREVSCATGVLSSIVQNLLSNAIKYMPADRDRRLVSIRATEERRCLHVEIADTGAGIPDDAKERIFDPYVRANAVRPGLGLGLATVKRLVLSHGGRLGVKSRVGAGSTFWFELPLPA
jgi:signal transduction histidine kinase